jgi:thiosulfate dehydrogenase (quinone) large subunit
MEPAANSSSREPLPRRRSTGSAGPRAVSPAAALLPLRGFLGVTFVYAGIQKLSDPGFLHKGAPTYIGSQLHSFAQGTPGGFLLRTFALPHPGLAGFGVALLEIAVGLLVLAGLRTRAAAAVGLGLNLTLFLTASWKTSPYFLGSDIVFAFAWLPFVLAGAAGQPALDRELERLHGRARAARGAAAGPGRPVTRRALLTQMLGAAGLATLSIAGLATLAKGRYRGHTVAALTGGPAKPSTHKTGAHAASPAKAGGGAPPPGAVRLGRGSQLPAGQAAVYRDPSDGQPDVVVRAPDGSLAAHSALCTHASCQVQYQQGTLYCPCHGSAFNPRTGSVEQGPANAPLPPRKVVEHAGVIYALPS